MSSRSCPRSASAPRRSPSAPAPPRKRVDAALVVAGSTLAQAAVARYGEFLDLTQAAVVAEVEDDAEAVKALVAAARTGQFDHVAQRIRDERAREALQEAFADSLRAQGVRVVDRNSGLTILRDLADPAGATLTADSPHRLPRPRRLPRLPLRLRRPGHRPAPGAGRVH